MEQVQTHRYTLEKYAGSKTRYTCPSCGKKKVLALYVDTESNNEYLNDQVGRCNREVECGYHYTPKLYFADNDIPLPEREAASYTVAPKREPKREPKPKVNIPADVMQKSLSRYDTNKFISFLKTLFDDHIVDILIERYNIATSNGADYWGGGTGESVIFWFINKVREIRYGQVKLFNESGHTAKFTDATKDNELSTCTTGIHYLIKSIHKKAKREFPQWLNEYQLQDIYLNCFFGEHLLSNPQYSKKPIAIVEACKTAIVASVYFNQYTWLAVGSLSYLTEERCKILRNKKVTLFPDLGAYSKWSDRAIELQHIADFTVNDILEQIATDEQRAKGWDLCDYMATADFREELKDEFKEALLALPEDNCGDDAQRTVIIKFDALGLRRTDRGDAYRELLAGGAISI